MKNKTWILITIILVVLTAIGIYFYMRFTKTENEQNYEATKTSTNEEENTSISENQKQEEEKDKEQNKENSTNQNEKKQTQYKEEQLSSFSTKIYSKDSERQNNIKITCNTLNDTIIKNGETFSFCNTVGKATTAKGYQEADVFDHNGNKTKGLRWWKLPSK